MSQSSVELQEIQISDLNEHDREELVDLAGKVDVEEPEEYENKELALN